MPAIPYEYENLVVNYELSLNFRFGGRRSVFCQFLCECDSSCE